MKLTTYTELVLTTSLILLWISPTMQKAPRSTQYPHELHRRVMERLSRRRGQMFPENGQWSHWSQWSPCSRSCGTGVSTQTRECKQQKKKYSRISHKSRAYGCVGRYKRFQLCNTQECLNGPVDIRKEQCSFHNRTPFNKKFYAWEPYIDSPESCTLNCRAIGLSFYATLNQSVIDGTPCGTYRGGKPNKICAGGKCLSIGCDGLLGSSKTLDQCGICGGDGNSCKLISSSFDHPQLPEGYNIITTLPPEAENVSIYHTEPSSNFIALRKKGGSYILNGPVGMNSSGTSRVFGYVLSYQKGTPFQGDRIFIRGPLRSPVDVLLFYRSINPGVRLEYRIQTSSRSKSSFSSNPLNPFPKGTSKSLGVVNDAIFPETTKEKKPRKSKKYRKSKNKHKNSHEKRRRKRYMWIAKGYTPCDRQCGEGKQTTRIFCVKRRRKEIEAPVQMCAGLPKPLLESVRCNLKPCDPQWEPSDWSTCSVTCGIGYQIRTLECRRRISVNSSITLQDGSCQNSEKLETAQICRKRECNGPPIWEMGEWSKCSSDCGLGTRRRTIVCLSTDGPVSDKYCKDKRPLDEELCDMGSCATDTWLFSSWDGQCNGPCGEGILKRSVFCSGNGRPSNQYSSCSLESKPPDTKQCSTENQECGGTWFSGPWNKCDAISCEKEGQQRRTVICLTWDRRKYRIAKDDSYCKSAGDRPPDSKMCAVPCTSKWFTSDWSQCSVSCGRGIQRREVKCLNGFGEPDLECKSDQKPDSRQNCHITSCRKEVQGDSEDLGRRTIPSKSTKKVPKAKDLQNPLKDSCMDRMKNCNLVLKARLCKLKYYNSLCCNTCKQ